MATWTEWKLSDLIWGILLPCLAAFLIIIFPMELGPILRDVDSSGILNAIFVDGLAEALLIVGIPMFAGLIWNKWAGGGSGFLLGSIYALYANDVFAAAGMYTESMMIGDISNLGYVVCAMLTGFIAGALNRDSYSFRRMVVAGLVGGFIAGFFLLWTQLISPLGMVTVDSFTSADLSQNSLFLTFLPRLIYGIIIPIFATVFGWFGMTPRHMG